MNKINISRPLYNSDRIVLSSYLLDPCVLTTEARMNVKSYCAVNIMIPRKDSNTNMKGLTFSIPPELYRKFMNTLEMVIHWFYDPGKKDLFCLDDKNIPHFNSVYQNLKYVVKNKRNGNRIDFAPAEVEVEGTIVEGVILTINYLDNISYVSLSELEDIYSILSNFSYQSEILVLSQMYTFGLITKRMMSPSDYSNHCRFESYGNINPVKNPFTKG